MLKFDLTNIPGLPNNANITEVALDLYYLEGDTGVAGDLCSLFVISKHWNSTEVTWNNATTTDAWEQLDLDTKFFSNEVGDTVEYPGGGDRLFPCAATAPVATVSHRWESYTITDVMKKYIKNPGNFHGLLLKPYFGNSSRWYMSSEYSEVDKRPKMTIEYSGTGIKKDPATGFVSNCLITTASKNIRIYIPLNSSYHFTISDLRGRTLYSFTGYGRKWYNLPEGALENGSYILHVKKEHAKINKRFMVAK